MNTGTTRQYEEFVLRRLTEPISLFGKDLDPRLWLLVLIVVLLVGVIYISIMYARDAVGMYRQGSTMPLWVSIPALLVLLIPSAVPWLCMPLLGAVLLFTCIFFLVQRDLHLPSWLLAPGLVVFVFFPPVLAVMLFAGIVYLFVRPDGNLVRSLFSASVLGLLRLCVYTVIAFIFLLPSKQSWEEQTTSSKVVAMFDMSESMRSKDDIPDEKTPFDKLPTRQDKVQKFLDRSAFIDNLTKKNPTTVYRFASAVDPDFLLFDTASRTWTKAEWTELEEKMRQPGFNPESLPEKRPLDPVHWNAFLNPNLDPNAKGLAAPAGMSQDDEKRFDALIARNRKLAGIRWFSATNLGDATLNTLSRELNNMVQGIVIFTDGRSTEGGDAAFDQIAERAKAAHIPIFVVGVGEERPHVRIEITDLRAPQQVQPEDKFRIVMEVTGEGLAEKEFLAGIKMTCVRKKDDNTIEPLDITIREQEDKKNPKKERPLISLGKELVLKPEKPPVFDRSNPPRVEIEYAVDAVALATAANKLDILNEPGNKNKKWEIGETKEGEEYRFQAVVPRDKLELSQEPFHKSDLVDLRVVKRPLRVLLFASAATHDFQFLNNMMIREVEQQRADLSVYVQPPPGKDPAEWRKSVVLGVKPERMLGSFPDKFDQDTEKPEDKVYDLNEYDVIVAFDPDWSKLSDDQLKLVNKWCEKGGGIVMVGGPINTLQLARPGPNKIKLQPILDLLPVVLKDVRIEALDRDTKEPWPLFFDQVNPEMEFLKLAEETDKGPPPFLDDWKEYFYGKDGKGVVKRGFFNYYPSELVKTGSLIVARFMDPRAKMKDGTQMPYIVLSDPAGGRRVVWLAWGETRRLRQHSESFYERFWTKLLRYTGAGNQTNLVKRVRIDMNRTFTAGKFVTLDAKIDAKNGEPLFPRRDKDMPTITLKLPAGVADNEIPKTYPLVPKKSKDESDKGKFSVRFQVKSPGDYQLELKVPETGDSVLQKFNVKESNPELDNTRPDFDQMYHLASEADPVLIRLPEADRQELKRHLKPPTNLGKADDKSGDKPDAVKDGKLRLYFTLDNAHLIPNCMVTATDTKQNKGPYKDVWDKGLDLGIGDVHLNWLLNALVLIVGLLSMEWLIRKLLRLA